MDSKIPRIDTYYKTKYDVVFYDNQDFKHNEKHLQFMIDAYNDIPDCPVSKYVTAMAHPFFAVACPYPNSILYDLMTDDEFKRVFYKTAEKNIAVEINTGVFRKISLDEIELNPRIRMYKLAKECGCKFLFGSDAHSDNVHQNYIAILDKITQIVGITEKDILEI